MGSFCVLLKTMIPTELSHVLCWVQQSYWGQLCFYHSHHSGTGSKKSFHMLIHSDAIELGDHLLLWGAAGRGGSSVGRGRISLLFRWPGRRICHLCHKKHRKGGQRVTEVWHLYCEMIVQEMEELVSQNSVHFFADTISRCPDVSYTYHCFLVAVSTDPSLLNYSDRITQIKGEHLYGSNNPIMQNTHHSTGLRKLKRLENCGFQWICPSVFQFTSVVPNVSDFFKEVVWHLGEITLEISVRFLAKS